MPAPAQPTEAAQQTMSAASAAAAQPMTAISADPTRAALAEQAPADDLWFLAPQTQGHAAPSSADASEEDEPSTLSTIFWTVMTGVLVVALVLAFLHFLTGVFR